MYNNIIRIVCRLPDGGERMAVDFASLPESLESEELEGYFKEFLDMYGNERVDLFTLKQLYELAYRQWDTYESLDEELKSRLDDYVMGGLNFADYDLMDVTLSFVENLSLKSSFHYIVDNKDKAKTPQIRRLIEEAEEEYSDTIDNPFDLF